MRVFLINSHGRRSLCRRRVGQGRAAVNLMLVATSGSGGPTMFARIGVMRALNRHVERVFNPSRKETQWGRRKLARDR
jgi:hypothetical protein